MPFSLPSPKATVRDARERFSDERGERCEREKDFFFIFFLMKEEREDELKKVKENIYIYIPKH